MASEQELKSDQQREILTREVNKLLESNSELYYMSTIDVANELMKRIQSPGRIPLEDQLLVKHLSAHDIQMLLSMHS